MKSVLDREKWLKKKILSCLPFLHCVCPYIYIYIKREREGLLCARKGSSLGIRVPGLLGFTM